MAYLSAIPIGKQTRILVLAGALALAALSSPALQGQALAAPNCVPAGCGKATCTYDGKTYGGGETIIIKRPNGKKDVYHCDGNTGQWVKWRTADEEPMLDLPTTAVEP